MKKENLLPPSILLNNKEARLYITRSLITDSTTLDKTLYWVITYKRLDKKNLITEMDIDFETCVKKMLIFLIKKDLF